MTTAYKTALGLRMLPPLAATSLGNSADHMAQLIGFHALYDVPMKPLGCKDPEFLHMDDERVSLRLGLITEELGELFEAVGITFEPSYTVERHGQPVATFNEHAMKTGKALQRARGVGHKRNGRDVADALGDLVYVIYGMALEMGYDLREVIQEIHGSNMTKLGEDGKPIYREDGKVLKGPNYMKPNIPAALGWEKTDG